MDTTTDNDYTIMSGSTYAHKLNIENLHRAEMLTVRGEMQCDNVHKVQKYALLINEAILVWG